VHNTRNALLLGAPADAWSRIVDLGMGGAALPGFHIKRTGQVP
jgi:hypothetical protein